MIRDLMSNKLLLIGGALVAAFWFLPDVFGGLYLPSLADVQYCAVSPTISNPVALALAGLVVFFIFEHGRANQGRLAIAAAVMAGAVYVTTNYFC